MEIKKIIDQVRSKLNSEELEKVNGLLSEVIRAGDDLLSDRSAANNESKSRKEKIREYEKTIETLTAERDTAKTDLDTEKKNSEELTKYKTKWDDNTTKRDTENKAKWETISKNFDLKETDPNFQQVEKLKKYYKFGEEITSEQIASNLKQVEQHTELGLFKVDKVNAPNTPGKTGENTKTVVNPFS